MFEQEFVTHSRLRRSEIVALKWKDVDLKKGILTIRAATVIDKNGKVIRREKSECKFDTKYDTKEGHPRRDALFLYSARNSSIAFRIT